MPSSDKKAVAERRAIFGMLDHGDGDDGGTPVGVRDIAILCPEGDTLTYWAETKLYAIGVPDLVGVFILSYDGSTRPYKAPH